MLNLFNIDDESNFIYMLEAAGRNVTVNNSSAPIKALITNSKLETNYDDRYVSTLEGLQRGDLIDYNNKKYMIISEVNDRRYGHYKGVIRHLPHEIVFNHDCRFQSISCYIDNGSPSLASGQVLTLIDDKITVYLPINIMNVNISSGDVFMIQGNKFKIVTNDTYSSAGIAILTCQREQINPANDDVKHNIANGLACSINLTNNEPITVYVEETLQLTWASPYDAPVTFESSNNTIATVDAEGLVSGHTEGEVTIIVSNASNNLIFVTTTVNVESIPIEKSIKLVFSKPNQKIDDYYYLYANATESFTAIVYEGNTAISEAVTFQMYADDKVLTPSLNAFTGTTSGNVYTITSKSAFIYIQLKVTLDSDPYIYTWQRIRIRSFL